MVADLRKVQENQGFSENRIDKLRFIYFFVINTTVSVGCNRRNKSNPIGLSHTFAVSHQMFRYKIRASEYLRSFL